MNKILFALIFTAGLAAAADATGKWSGSFAVTMDGESKDDTAFLNLKQEGTKITGEAGPRADRTYPIKTGTIEGDKIKLEVQQPNGPIVHFDLTLKGDQITGDAKAEGDGHSMKAKVDVKREK